MIDDKSFEELSPLNQLKVLDNTLRQDNNSVVEYSPLEDIEKTLISFLRKRLDKIENDVSFEDRVKNILFERLQELDSIALIKLLDILQKNNNQGTMAILTPFLGNGNNNRREVPNVIERTKQEISIHIPERELFEKADKNVLQGLNELKNLLFSIAERRKECDKQ